MGVGAGAASAHSDPVVIGFGVMVVCALLSAADVEGVVDFVGVVMGDRVGGG